MKKALLIFFTSGMLAVAWYLFIKKYDYQFTFDAAYGPGSIYEEITALKQLNPEDSIVRLKLLKKEPFNTIVQRAALTPTDSIELLWHIKTKNDSISTIIVNTRSLNKPWQHRLAILNPFKDDNNIKLLKKNLKRLRNHLHAFQQSYRIQKKGPGKSPAANCACVSNSSTARGKATAMRASIDLLEDFVARNKLHQVDYPIVQLTQWNKKTDVITFDFCFPLNKTPKKPPNNNVFIKKIESKEALLARFNGNYNLSHRAWYDLYEQAKEEELSISGFPLEVFKSNPKNGGYPITWEAEIYLPVTP